MTFEQPIQEAMKAKDMAAMNVVCDIKGEILLLFSL